MFGSYKYLASCANKTAHKMYANWRPMAVDMLQEYLFNPVRKILFKRIPILTEETKKKCLDQRLLFLIIFIRQCLLKKIGQMFFSFFLSAARKPSQLPIFLSKVDLCPNLWPR